MSTIKSEISSFKLLVVSETLALSLLVFIAGSEFKKKNKQLYVLNTLKPPFNPSLNPSFNQDVNKPHLLSQYPLLTNNINLLDSIEKQINMRPSM
jgi:hypothetical protein